MNQAEQTPDIDLMNEALKHYDEAATSITHHRSDIPQAIKFYYKHRKEFEYGGKEYVFNVEPMGKPRMTQRDKWMKPARPAVAKYWRLKRNLSIQARKMVYEVDEILSGDFHIKMPKSWSKKKKDLMRGKPHKQKPDLSNLVKAFEDCLCEDDSYIWSYKDCNKFWSDEGKIVIRS